MTEKNSSRKPGRRIAEARNLPRVPVAAAKAYAANRESLAGAVHTALANRKDLPSLIGGNAVEMLPLNHEHLGALMANVFLLNQLELLTKTIAWVYRIYHARGFSYEYVPIELRAWMDAVEKQLAPEHQAEIVAIYQWVIDAHDEMILLAGQPSGEAGHDPARDTVRLPLFLHALLDADHAAALSMANDVKGPADFESFLLEVIQPAMYEIGKLWEKGAVSVAQEHLASSIVSRVMSQLYTANVSIKPTRGRVVVTAAPNEYHELGAWMVSDLLELDGWQVRYLGANTPVEDLLKLLEEYQPQLLVLSVTMPFNLDKVQNIVTAVRKKESLRSMKIMVGGRVFLTMPGLWSELGADGTAADAREAVAMAHKLCT